MLILRNMYTCDIMVRYYGQKDPSAPLRTSYKPFGGYHYTWSKWADGSIPTNRQTDYRYTGQRQESDIKLYDYISRWYDYRRGRLVQADTIVPEPGDPQSLNRYSFVLNNPLKLNDLFGPILLRVNLCQPHETRFNHNRSLDLAYASTHWHRPRPASRRADVPNQSVSFALQVAHPHTTTRPSALRSLHA